MIAFVLKLHKLTAMGVWQFVLAGYLLVGPVVYFFIFVRCGDWWKKPISAQKYWWRFAVADLAKPRIVVLIQLLRWPILLVIYLLTHPGSDEERNG